MYGEDNFKMENLDWLEWESPTSPFGFGIVQHGAFPEKAYIVELSRQADLKLKALGKGEGSFQLDEHIQIRPGEPPPYSEDTIGQTQLGEQVRLRGVILRSSRNKSNSLAIEETDPLFIEASVDEVEVIQSNLPIVSHIEWIANFSVNYQFTKSTQREWYNLFIRQRSGEAKFERNLDKRLKSNLDHFICECTTSGVRKWSLTVGTVLTDSGQTNCKPGYVEFTNINNFPPSEDEKQTILKALSFTIGRQLASVGSTSLAEDGERVSYTVRSLYHLRAESYNQPCMPPAPLGVTQNEYFIDENKVSKIMSAVALAMKHFDIEYPLLLAWLGLSSPLDVSTAHLGAAIESLRDSYTKSNTALETTLIPKKIWKEKFKEALLDAFNRAVSKHDTEFQSLNSLEVLRRKIGNLNDKSSNMKYDEFFELISLKVGEVELRALRERNNPAHGYRYKTSQYHALAMTKNALYSLFNRLVLKLTGASECYIDYSTYGYPVRDIDEPLGGPEGDGNPAMK